ncbi:D(2) dopamine receptor A-like [Babylonia areolata]|uniref:D(2) dopamine receptor A-like n=1 Tax=Babylonia areolata TaxID=304850 RepID=UPI003FD573D5
MSADEMTMTQDSSTFPSSSSSAHPLLNDSGSPPIGALLPHPHHNVPHHHPPTSPVNDTTATMTMTMMMTTMDEEEAWAELERLNGERAMYFLPAIVWLVLLMVVGVVGNALVIYVYRRRFKRTSSNYFILTMAIFDLVACLIGLPTEIYDLLKPFTFYSEFGCKLFRSTESFTIYGSVVVLVEIAFDRYFKICRPLMIVSLFKIKVLCALAVLVAVLMAIPSAILFGITRFSTQQSAIRGYDCSVSDTYRKTAFSYAYYICLAVAFLVTLVILTALYVRIWLELRQRRRMVIGDQLTKPRDHHHHHGSGAENGAAQAKKFRVRYIPSMSDEEMLGSGSRFNSATQLNTLTPTPATPNANNSSDVASSSSASLPASSKRSRFSALAHYASNMHVSRTTVVLFAVTVAFVLSFLPALAVMVVRTVVKDFEENQSMGSLAVSKFFLKFSFINNAINPIIYSFLNINFRRQARKAVEKLFCCCCRRRHRHMPQKTDSDRSTKKEFLHV